MRGMTVGGLAAWSDMSWDSNALRSACVRKRGCIGVPGAERFPEALERASNGETIASCAVLCTGHDQNSGGNAGADVDAWKDGFFATY